MQALRQYLPLPGRILLGLVFLLSGIFKIPGWEPTLGFMVSTGVPLAALFLLAAIVLEIAGGLALMAGYRARLAATALAAFSIVTALIFHNFWTFTGLEQQAQMSTFLKNFSIAGGMMFVVAFGPGALSLDMARRNAAATGD